MKSILLFALTLCVIALTRAEDDGKYRAERYASDGRYFNNYNGRYDNGYRHYPNNYYPGNNYFPSNNYYPSWNQPFPYNARPHSDLLAPFASSGKDNSAADNAVIKPKPIEVKPAVTVVAPTTAAPKIHLPAVVSTTAIPRVAYAKYGNEGLARIVSQESDAEATGYNYSFRTENGINVGESGLVDAANSRGGTRVKGFYEYVGDDGIVYRVDYTADENGFHATGAHLP